MKISRKIKKIERIKDLRQRIRDDMRVRLEDAFQREKVLETEIDELESRRKRALSHFLDKSASGCISPGELIWIREGIGSLEKDMKNTKIYLEKTRQEVGKLQEELRELHRETKLAETFLESACREKRKLSLKKEQQELDELTMLSYVK